MKATIIAMILTFSLGLVGCATTQAGSGAAPASSGAKNGKMLTEEDYKRIGVKETGVR
jgi:outer membrane lipoprotein SlyB